MGVTADSLPSQSEGLSGTDAAVEQSLTNDLVVHVRTVGRTAARNVTLDAVTRIFGPRVEDDAHRIELGRCRARAEQLIGAGADLSTGVALAYASDIFVLCSMERAWRCGEAERIVSSLGSVLGLSSESIALQLFLGAAGAPQLLDVPPAVALETQLRLLVALGPGAEISLWTKGPDGRPSCLIDAGVTTQTRRFRAVAESALAGSFAESGARGTILGAPVMRWETPWAALVARTRVDSREVAGVFLTEAAAAMSPVIEREVVLERSASRERSLVSASERRLGRLAFDLHDGALQHIAALGADLYLFKRQLTEVLPGSNGSTAVSRIEDLDARIWELDRVLRELAHSLEPSSLVRRPLPRVIADEVAAFTERTGIEVQQQVNGEFSAMTVSQKIALVRIVQEALTNVREHANASSVKVTVTARSGRFDARVEDDGVGFRVSRTLLDAAKRGRLGLVGSSERVRLLGGKFDVRSRPGGPTTVSISLPRWQPLAVEHPLDSFATPALALD